MIIYLPNYYSPIGKIFFPNWGNIFLQLGKNILYYKG